MKFSYPIQKDHVNGGFKLSLIDKQTLNIPPINTWVSKI